MSRKIDWEVSVSPVGRLDMLSRMEAAKLRDAGQGGLHRLFRRCALAVLNSGADSDDATALYEQYQDFQIRIEHQERGIILRMRNAPALAFVDGDLIQGIREHLFSVLRDVVYVSEEIEGRVDLESPGSITDAVFEVLRNAGVLRPRVDPAIVVCWGGHSISREEYDYAKSVGYELGLRQMHICTGCGPGAMKGPMKGAAVAHAKQRIWEGRYLGFTEPGIIAAEPPNPIVNELVIMPDIEKRLEAFVRAGHGIVVFPGGVGTAEEILYLLGLLLDPANASQPFPLVFSGPASAEPYFRQIDEFIRATLGEGAASRYQVVLDNPPEVARVMRAGLDEVKYHRKQTGDAYFFNWTLTVPHEFQLPFEPTHASMAGLDLRRDQPPHRLAANLRRAFSGIVAGNVKEQGRRAIEEHGPFEIRGDPTVMKLLDGLLDSFVAQHRMRLPGVAYSPCYRLVA